MLQGGIYTYMYEDTYICLMFVRICLCIYEAVKLGVCSCVKEICKRTFMNIHLCI